MKIFYQKKPGKTMLRRTATIKRFEHSPLGSELKKKTSFTKYQNQGLERVCKFDKKVLIKQKKGIKSNRFSSNKFTFCKYYNTEKFTNLSFASKRKDLKEFQTKLN